jgi:hydrogenase nickel incorporation protein HypB
MCAHCGCSEGVVHEHDVEHDRNHGHGHAHEHRPQIRPDGRMVRLQLDLLAKNDRLAEQNRARLRDRRILAVNLVASPGAGKTTLLERTVRELGSEIPIHVVEADPATERDAERLRTLGCRVVQVNTGTGCHLDADMVRRSLDELHPANGSVVFFENVGNLVCPALFDLGEAVRVVVTSLPEGEDKPIKYPHIFRSSHAMVLNKIDLLPHLSFDRDSCMRFAREVKPELAILELSATRGDGMAAWYDWLRHARAVLASSMLGSTRTS